MMQFVFTKLSILSLVFAIAPFTAVVLSSCTDVKPEVKPEVMMWHAQANHMMSMTQEYKQSMMMDMSVGDANSEFDLRFMNAMIPHHEGALVMAKDVQLKSKRSELQSLAKDIL